jgi:hypothetical protein
MKTNKKAVLGFAIAMIFSLAMMQGMNMKSNHQDVNVQQMTAAAGYMAVSSEGGAAVQTAWGFTSALGWETSGALWTAAGAAAATGILSPAALVIGGAAVVTTL